MPAGVTDDYTNRTVDIESLQTIENITPLQELNLTLRSSNLSRRVTGMQKLAQRYATIFLTQKGTVGYAPNQGSAFIGSATGGLIANGANLNHFFNVANFQTIRQLQNEDSNSALGATPPDDERIQSARLAGFEVNQFEGTLNLRVSITSVAGENYIYVLPAV